MRQSLVSRGGSSGGSSADSGTETSDPTNDDVEPEENLSASDPGTPQTRTPDQIRLTSQVSTTTGETQTAGQSPATSPDTIRLTDQVDTKPDDETYGDTDASDDGGGGGNGGIISNVQDTVGDATPSVSVPSVSISDDWTSTEDALGYDATNVQDLQENVGFISDDWSSTEDALGYESETIHSLDRMGEGIVEKKPLHAMAGAGELVVNTATGGDADEFVEDYQEENPEVHEYRRRVKDSLDDDSTILGTLGASNELVKTGLDAMLDAPGDRFNVQDKGMGAAQTVTGADSHDEAAQDIQNVTQSWMDVRSAPARALPSWVPGSEGSRTADVVGTGFDWFVQYPIEATITATTGVDPRSGEQDARAEPVDLLEAPLVGVGLGTRGARAGYRALSSGDEAAAAASRGSGAADETTQAASEATETTTRTASESPTATAGISTTALTAGVSSLAGGIQSGMLRGLSSLRRLGRSTPSASGVDDTVQGVTSNAASGVDDLGASQRTVGTSDDAHQFAEPEFTGISDDAPSAGATPSSGSTSIDDVTSGNTQIDDFQPDTQIYTEDSAGMFPGMADETTEVATQTPRQAATRSFDSAEDFSQGTTQVATEGLTGAASRMASGPARAARAALPDSLSGLFRRGSSGADETAQASDEMAETAVRSSDETTASGADEFQGGTRATRSSDEMAQGADESTSRLRQALWGNRGPLQRVMISAAGAVGADAVYQDITGNDSLLPFGLGADVDGAGQGSPYSSPQVGSYEETGATLHEVREGENVLGYAIYAGKESRDAADPMVGQGAHVVVSNAGRPTRMNPLGDTDMVPQARFGSQSQADDAHAEFVRWLKENGHANQQGDSPQGTLDGVSADVSVPEQIGNSAAFSAAWLAELDGRDELSGRLSLGVADEEGGYLPIAEDSVNLTSQQPTQESTVEVQSGWQAVEPGTYDFLLVYERDGEPAVLAEASTEVVESGQGDGQGSGDGTDSQGWGDPEMAEELPYGWYLYAQPNLQSGETRFFVVGQRDDGTQIYLQSGGRASEQAHPFSTVEEAASALDEWVARVQGGQAGAEEIPNPDAGRPQPEQVKQDAAEADTNGVTGIISRITRLATDNPVLFAGGTAATAIVAYYLYDQGYFNSTLKKVKR